MSDDNLDGGNASPPPTILYTKKRTRTAASSARRRANKGLIQAASLGVGNCEDGGKDQHSWFARKSAGWTDNEIKEHLTTGGTSQGGKSFSMIGDVILGDGGGGNNNNGKKHKNKKKKTKQRRGGPTFAWEEEEEEEDIGDGYNVHNMQSRMTAAPTLKDIMDEQDEVDFMSPLKVGKSYQMNDSSTAENANSKTNDGKSSNSKLSNSRRRQNAALAELAQVSGLDHHGGSTRMPTSGNESIGYRLLRILGYRSRLGMAFVPLSGYTGGKDGIDNEVNKLQHERGKELTHERKWLASKRLRAIRLPSIQNADAVKDSMPKNPGKDGTNHNSLLTIPPPKNNRHGIGFDPFKNAPEFREFHERRRALAQKRGRATDDDNNKAEGSKRGDRYFTDNLRKDGRQALWDKDYDDGRNDDDDDDDMSAGGGVHGDKGQHQHSHYAADRDYTDFIGTKASDGFALHDEDDANVYGEGDVGDNDRGGDYTTEIQSPVTSDEEDNSGLFGSKSAMATSKRKVSEQRPSGSEDKVKVADAWSAWGMGEGSDNISGGVALKRTTMDGKPPLSGFTLGQSKFNIFNAQTEVDAPKRWEGPMVPSGYVLKRHVFQPEDYNNVAANAMNALDAGLGLDLQHRQQPHQSSRSSAPKVLPPTSSGKLKQPPASEKMLAKDGSEMNFHAVKESMKSRFVSSSAGGTDNTPDGTSVANDDKQNMDKEEWVNVSVSSWMPTRLLCKRWGINVPTATGLMPSATSELGGKVQGKEESYFRQTIMADHPNAGNTTTTSASSTNRGVGMQLDNYFLEDGENSAPPPSRPSAEVFQSIFNAESDMSISSDDDGSDGEEHVSNDERSTTPAEKELEKREDCIPNNETNGTKIQQTTNQVDNGGDLVGDEDNSDSSSSVSSKRKRKRRKKSDRRKDHRRRDDTNNSSDEESKRYYSDDNRRKRKKKKHKHRYRSKKSRH